jgi:tetratricopeptide (TPR) repeat protein
VAQRLAKKVLLIGWDSADWRIIEPMLEAGLMPTLSQFVENGVISNISSLRPMLSPMLWNSIATGKRADKHGILGFIEPKYDGSGIQAVTSTSRKCKAVWNILSQNGLRSNVVSWYASYPAEPISGVCVTEHFLAVPWKREEATPPAPQSVHPAAQLERLSELRVYPSEIGPWHIGPFVPKLGEIPPDQTPPVTGLQKMLARCGTVHAVATELMEHEPWDFTAVYYEAIDHFCHGFMQYQPPRMPHVGEQQYEWFNQVVTGIYRFHDMMLQRLLELAGDDTTVIICSDHGFLSGELRPVETPQTPVGPEGWHRLHGIFAMKGPGIVRDERIYGASILDIAPTILHLLGLPVGEDMDGKVLVGAFEQPQKIERIDSWEKVSGDSGMHSPEAQVDPFANEQALAQLVELGYIAEPSKHEATNIKVAKDEQQFSLAAVHTDANRPDLAVPILEAMLREDPKSVRVILALAHCYLTLGRNREARQLLDGPGPSGEQPRLSAQADLIRGALEFSEGNIGAALKRLQQAEAAEPLMPLLHLQIGSVYAQQRRWADAERAFRRAMNIDCDSPHAHFGVGQAAMYQGRTEEAVEHLLRAVGLMHYYPRAHFLLGVALARMGWHDRAVQAFQVTLSLSPGMPIAHRFLAALYNKLNDPQKALFHRRRAQILIDAARATRVSA